MIANAYLPSTEYAGQITHPKKSFPYFQQQLDDWVKRYQQYLFGFDGKNHFKWLAYKAFLEQDAQLTSENQTEAIVAILSQALESALSQIVLWSARLMASESGHFWPWVEEFAIEIIELQADGGCPPLAEAICKAFLEKTIGLHSMKHANAWHEHYHGEKEKPRRWTDRLSALGRHWYYPDYMVESDVLPNGLAYIQRLHLSEQSH